MAAPSVTWTSKQVKVTYRNPFTLAMESGTWYAEMTGRVTNTLANGTKQVFRPGKLATGNLNVTEGLPSLTVDLPVVDDPDNSPQGGEILLTINFATGGSEVYHLSPLENWPAVTDLANILDPTIVPAAPLFVIKGVPGGVAGLDAQGDVVNAAGSKITGGTGTTLTNYSQVAGTTGYPTSFPSTPGNVSGLLEYLQDEVAAIFNGTHTNITFAYNDATGKITATVTGGTGGLDAEGIRDTVAAALLGSGMVSVVANDAGDTITIAGSQALTDALAAKAGLVSGKLEASVLTSGSPLTARKVGGVWPARPTARTDLAVFWVGPAPEPAVVTSGTGGMLDGADLWFATP